MRVTARELLKGLAEHLRLKRDCIVREQEVCYGDSDPTYGPPVIAKFEVIDFDRMMDEIDAFAETFSERKGENDVPVKRAVARRRV